MVTGGAGFIGSHTVRALVDQGARVSIVDNLCTGRRENIHPAASFYKMNTADNALAAVFDQERPEYIYHFAFNVLVPRSVENPLLDIDSIAGSLNLLCQAKRTGVTRIIFPSSGFIYGNNPHLPVKESEPFDPISPYAIAKYMVEQYLEFFRRNAGISYVILRYAAVYGIGQVTGAMADYIRTLRKGGQADMWGDGNKTRDYVYIEDVVRANLLGLEVPADHPFPVFNIGTGKETSLNVLYALIAHLLGKEAQPHYHADRLGEQICYALDSTKAKTVLKWEPQVLLEEGVKNVIAQL